MKITRNENRLLWAIRDMVGQNCDTRNDDDQVFNSGFIRAHRTAMEILVEYGHMKLLSEDESGGRWYEARMVEAGNTPNAFGNDVEGYDPAKAAEDAALAIGHTVEHFFDERPIEKAMRERAAESDSAEIVTEWRFEGPAKEGSD